MNPTAVRFEFVEFVGGRVYQGEEDVQRPFHIIERYSVGKHGNPRMLGCYVPSAPCVVEKFVILPVVSDEDSAVVGSGQQMVTVRFVGGVQVAHVCDIVPAIP